MLQGPVKENGKLREEVYRVGGRYDKEIRQVIGHLEAAGAYATPTMRTALAKLVQWYRTGEDADRRAYDIAWVADLDLLCLPNFDGKDLDPPIPVAGKLAGELAHGLQHTPTHRGRRAR